MKKVVILALICAFFSQKLLAQNVDEDAVKKTVSNLFLGMKTGDSALAASAFAS